MRVIIVDDEELSLLSLEKKLQKFPNIQVVKTYSNQAQVLEDIKKEQIDVAFLDIQMREENGLDLAESILSLQSSIHIVFVTAHSEYAVQAFEINSIDYLLKPVTTMRLQKTIHRLTEQIEKVKAQNVPDNSSSTPRLIIQCFNELQVFYNGRPLHFKTAKVKELFAFFLTHFHTYLHRDIIIDSLWPLQDYKKSKIHLHTCISHLRKMLDHIGYANCLTFSNQSYLLSCEPIDCDAFRFEKVVQNLSCLDETNIQIVEDTIQLYKGAYLRLNGFEWAYQKAQDFHKKMMDLLNRVIVYFQEKDSEKALLYLQFQRKLDPYLEKTIKQLMQLLMRQGNRTEAIKVYQEYQALLFDELGIEPDDRLSSLYDSLFAK